MGINHSDEEPSIDANIGPTDEVIDNEIEYETNQTGTNCDQHSMWWLNVRRRCHKHSHIKRSHIRRKH